MNQQQGDERVAAIAAETGLNPVLCAQHMAIQVAWDNYEFIGGGRHTWTLAAWRASNASQTMAAMTEQPQAEDDAGRRERLLIERSFHYMRNRGKATVGLDEMLLYRDGFREGWDARAQQEAKA